MPAVPRSRRPKRRPAVPLTRERVLEAALRLADEEGIEAVSMRRLGSALDVEAMSLYKHVAGKEDILDGVADLVMAEVELPRPGDPWKPAVRAAALSTAAALRRHPWAAPVLESRRTPGPMRLRYLEAVVGTLREAGFSTVDVARAFLAVDSQVYGYTVQVSSLPAPLDDAPEFAATMAAEVFGDAYPHLAAMARLAATPGAVPMDLDFGLDLVLDGLERVHARRRGRAGREPAADASS